MPDPRHEFGLAGEKAAERFLKKAGMKCLLRRFKTTSGELDLVMREKDTIVFVEVKTRRDRRWAEPEDAVTTVKCRRMLAAARWLIQRKRWHDRPLRFDVVSVVIQENQPPDVRHFREAFVPRD